jgi:BirA family transcriptional regulator, biotin operon repressor / biotin---[acetyl-CoA-carboxylase] ligase
MQGPIEFHLPRVTSTNDYARELLRTYPYVLVSAQHQTAGRGRKGRAWIGDHGANIYMSIGIRHADSISPEDLAAFMARGALSVVGMLRTCIPDGDFLIKYPNDVLARTPEGWSKISGVLVEHDFHGSICESSIIGIGVNVEQEEFPETIGQSCTSMRRMGTRCALPDVLATIRDMFTGFRSMPWEAVHQQWERELRLADFTIFVAGSTDPYTAQRVLPDGRLVLHNDITHQERIVSDGDSLRYQDRTERR